MTPMMNTQLTITSLMAHAEQINGSVEVVSVTAAIGKCAAVIRLGTGRYCRNLRLE